MNNIIIILTEGLKEEVNVINDLNKHFFDFKNMHILSYKTNIYSLYKQLSEDDFETDIVEILKEKNVGKDIICGEISINDINRDSISEIYLFFDYDAHHYGSALGRAIGELDTLVNHFDNETENGKLYISYPMVEALNHHNCYSDKEVCIYVFDSGKGKTSEGKPFKSLPPLHVSSKFLNEQTTKENWENIFKHYVQVSNHLHQKRITYSDLSSKSIFYKQKEYSDEKEQVLVLSSIPSFIFEYFGENYFTQIKNQTKIDIQENIYSLG